MVPATPSRKTKLAKETETRENTTIGGGSEAEQDTELMMDGAQTRKEVFTPTADLQTTIKVGCWNVRTLFQTEDLHKSYMR